MTDADTPARPAPWPPDGRGDDPRPAGLDAAEFGALLASRICHDLISPVGAVNNGVELLREIDQSADSAELQLIGRSAEMASANLQFMRIAFGAAPPGDAMGLPAAQRAARQWFDFQRPDLDWPAESGEITRAAARLIFNFLQIAVSALPRGGEVRVSLRREDAMLRLAVTAEGPTPSPAVGAAQWLAGLPAPEAPAPRDVHYVAAAAHARAAEALIDFRLHDHGLELSTLIPVGH